jgi:hypothetical protein
MDDSDMKRHLGTLALAALSLSACASRESRVEAALAKAGIPQSMAACLAPRITEQLNNDQLRALAKAAQPAPGESGRMNAREIVARVAGIGDPAIVEVVSGAALHCALKG